MKKYLLTLAVFALPLVTFAQIVNYHYKNERSIYTGSDSRMINRFPDSVRIEFPEYNILAVVEAKNFKDVLEALSALPATAGKLATTIKESHPTTEACKGHVVKQFTDFNDFVHTEITENLNYTTKVLSDKDQLVEVLPQGWEIYITATRHRMYIYTDEVSALSRIRDADVLPVVEKLKLSRTEGGRKSVKSRFISKDGSLAFSDVKFYQPLDMVSLSLSASVGVFRNTIFPEINGNLGFYIADRFNKRSHRIELSYNSMYFARQNAEGGYDVNYSPFAGISYSKNLGKEGTNWYGIGAAFLLNQAGEYDFFEGKTMKIFFTTTVGSGAFNVIPEIYLTNDFERAEFGMKVQYRF